MRGLPLDYLPVFLDLRGQRVLLVGGGAVAARKAALLLEAGAQLRIVSPERCAELVQLCAERDVQYLAAGFEPAHLDDCVLAVAATDDAAVNLRVAAAGRAARIFVNAVDDPAASSCLMPSIVDRSPVIVAIGTGGASPTLARRLRARIEPLLPERLGDLARAAGQRRAQVRAALPTLELRQRFWEDFFDSALAQRLLAGPVSSADAAAEFGAQLDAAKPGGAHARTGQVWLIGAGPGDPDLLTLRAQQLLQQCDVVLYLSLIHI